VLPALDGAGLHHLAAVVHRTTVRPIIDVAEDADLCAVQEGQRREAARSDEPVSLTVSVQALRSVLMCHEKSAEHSSHGGHHSETLHHVRRQCGGTQKAFKVVSKNSAGTPRVRAPRPGAGTCLEPNLQGRSPHRWSPVTRDATNMNGRSVALMTSVPERCTENEFVFCCACTLPKSSSTVCCPQASHGHCLECPGRRQTGWLWSHRFFQLHSTR